MREIKVVPNAKCFVQLQVRCELTQDVKWREKRGGGKKKVDKKMRGGEATLGFIAAFQLVEVSYVGRLQGAGRQRGSRPMGTSDNL